MPGNNMKIRLLISLLVCLMSFSKFPQASAEPSRATYTVINTNNMGTGSLRQAIEDSNSHTGADTIVFNIPAGLSSPRDEYYIAILDGFELTDPAGVTIDATTQPEQYADDIPEIWIAKSASPDEPVFTISTASRGNIIKGFVISGGSGGANTIVIDSSYNQILDNAITSLGGGDGIVLNPSAGFNSIEYNYIYGHTLNGIHLVSSNDNVISRNVIGLTPSWFPVLRPNGHHGILCAVCNNNQIVNNTISGNTMKGIALSTAGSNTISGNVIGLSKDGLTDQGNGQHGIELGDNCVGNNVFGNWVSGNGEDGIHLEGSSEINNTTNNHIELNAVGYAFDGSFIPNAQHGIGIYYGSRGNYVGKFGDATRGNIIGGNGWSGVVIVDSSKGVNYLYGNKILYNQYYGVNVVNSPDNYIGFNTIGRNGVHGTHAGVRIEGGTALRNAITTNSIYFNTGLGIELVAGGNAMLPEPVLYSATCNSVSGTTCAGCTVQIYSDREYEGEFYEDETVADGDGNFSYSNPLISFHGPNITAIAFSGSNTSPFALPWVGACQRYYLPMIFK